VDLVRPFYDFTFAASARPDERFVRADARGRGRPVDRLIDRLRESSAVIATLGTPPGGPPIEHDAEVAGLAVDIAARLLARRTRVGSDDDGQAHELAPRDIGISATHRAMNSAISRAIRSRQGRGLGAIRVDTPERWQGLERKVMIVVHPLSGVARPSAFDLETGRLCVMASRHRSGMVVVSRDHVWHTLENHFPSAEQAVGRPDVAGRGHTRNMDFWRALEERDCVIPCELTGVP
jgi:hypothetical protein